MLVGAGLSHVCCLLTRGSTGGFLLLRYHSVVVLHPRASGRDNTLFMSSPYL